LQKRKPPNDDSIEYEDVKVMVFGEAAIATGGGRSKGTNASGKSMDEHVRWTDTRTVSGNAWRATYRQ
jgi:hypothetical protein